MEKHFPKLAVAVCIFFGIILYDKVADANEIKTLKIVGEWKDVEFQFPTEELRQSALINRQYIPNNDVAIDVDVDYKDTGTTRVFITVPRFTIGIPFSLGVVSGRFGPNGPILQAYPDYTWHSSHGLNCDGITSVFRIAIDECHRLWVIDTGRIGDNQLCAPQILIFNLANDKLIHRYRFPYNQYRPGMSLFITPIVDVRDPLPGGTCSNTMLYIADVTGFAIMVYDLRRNKSWRTANKLVYPHPPYGTFNLAGETFDLMDGIFGMALTPRTQNGRYPSSDRILFFHALASITENSVPLRLLDNSTAWEENPDTEPRTFIEIGNRGTQGTAQAMDKNGNLFFGLIDPIAIACWDSSRPYKRENMKIVAQNDTTLQFVSGMKIVTNKYGKEELWLISCRFQRVMTGTRDPNEVNFRIQALQVDELLGGTTKCASGGVPTGNYAYPRY